MGQLLSTIDKCFQPEHLTNQDEASTIPASKDVKKQAAPAAPAARTAAVAPAATPSAPAPAATSSAPAPAATPLAAAAAPPAAHAAPVEPSGDLPPYTNRPEDLEGVTAASGRFVKKVWEIGVSPDLSGVKLSGEIVTDGKVSFDKAALSVEGVFPTRDEEVAQLQKAIDLKKDAAAATEQANVLHEEHNKLYESGDKDGAKGKLAESKTFRAKAQEIHQESFDLAYAGAMSMAIKAVFSKYPSIDYHVFLVDPYEKSYLVAIDMMKKYGKYGRKDFMVIPGEGQHSGSKGPLIRPHFEKWMADNKITNEQVTPGSYALKLDDVKM